MNEHRNNISYAYCAHAWFLFCYLLHRLVRPLTITLFASISIQISVQFLKQSVRSPFVVLERLFDRIRVEIRERKRFKSGQGFELFHGADRSLPEIGFRLELIGDSYHRRSKKPPSAEADSHVVHRRTKAAYGSICRRWF